MEELAMQYQRDLEKEIKLRKVREEEALKQRSKSLASKKTASGDRGKEWKDLAMRLKKLYEDRSAKAAPPPGVPTGSRNMKRHWR